MENLEGILTSRIDQVEDRRLRDTGFLDQISKK